jgi:hypothetical protein
VNLRYYLGDHKLIRTFFPNQATRVGPMRSPFIAWNQRSLTKDRKDHVQEARKVLEAYSYF